MPEQLDVTADVLDEIVEFTRPIPFDEDGRTESDSIRIAGEWCPGLAYPRGAGTPRIWDKRAGFGLYGRTLVYIGSDLSEFDIDITVWKQRQIDEWKLFYKKYLRDGGPESPMFGKAFGANATRAVGLYHPALALLGINAMIVRNCTAFEQHEDAESGMWGCTLSVTHWRGDPKPIVARPTEKIPDATKVQPTARTAAQIEIASLQVQAKRLEDHLASGRR